MFYGIHWSALANEGAFGVRGWAVPGGSVVEMEMLQHEVPSVQYTFLEVGVSDLNDNYVSDFRAEIVPLCQSLSQLRNAAVDWRFAKRVISQYPLKYLRAVFPTAGRSTQVMVGVREQLRKLKPRGADPSEVAVLSNESNTHDENIGDWPEARKLRNIALTRDSAGGTMSYQGPKRDAFFRLLKQGAARGKVVVLVMPESPVYLQEFATPEVQRHFNALLDEAQKQVPDALWVRLDQVPEFRSEKYYWDLVHLNAPGQARATEILRARLRSAGIF